MKPAKSHFFGFDPMHRILILKLFCRTGPALRLGVFALCAGLMLPLPSSAETLSELLALALGGEPTYLSAKTDVDAAKAKANQALGGLLPQVSASANSNYNDRNYKTRGDTVPVTNDRYNSNSAQLNLTQPLWHYANYLGFQQSKEVLAQANFQLAGAEQELFSKLVSAWFEVLSARDAVQFATQQVAAAQKQWEVVRRGVELGIESPPRAEDARARLDQALAESVSAETDSSLKFSALEQIVGTLRGFDPPYIREGATLADLSGDKLDTWQAEVETENPNVQAALRAFDAASAEENKQKAGHYPTLDLVGSYGRNSQAVGGFPGQAGYDITLGTIGLQLNVPLYSGGVQSAKVVEASAQKEKSRLQIEAAKRSAIIALKQAWYGWHTGHARALAGEQSIKAARSALEAARSGTRHDLKTELDILQAEQQLRAALRDYRKGRYDQVVAYVRLKSTAGKLTAEDISALDALFVPMADHSDSAFYRTSDKSSAWAPFRHQSIVFFKSIGTTPLLATLPGNFAQPNGHSAQFWGATSFDHKMAAALGNREGY